MSKPARARPAWRAVTRIRAARTGLHLLIGILAPADPEAVFAAVRSAARCRPSNRAQQGDVTGDGMHMLYCDRGAFPAAVLYAPDGRELPGRDACGIRIFLTAMFAVSPDNMPAARLVQPVNSLGAWLAEQYLPWSLRWDGGGAWEPSRFPLEKLPSPPAAGPPASR